MSGEDREATFGFNFTGNARDVSESLASSLENLRESIAGDIDALRAMSTSLRSIKGKSDEATAAKKALSEQMEELRNRVSAGNIALLKQGVAYDTLAQRAKRVAQEKRDLQEKTRKEEATLKESNAKLAQSVRSVGGPVSELREKMSFLSETFTGAGASMAVVGAGAAALVVAVTAVTAAFVAGAVELGKFIVTGANAARTMNLMREAASGSAENARALGTWVTDLANKVDLPREKLNGLASDITASFSGTRVSGQGIIDTFEAVGQASAAMGDQVGNRLREIIERSKQFGRVQISPFELQGTRLNRDDIAVQLAKQTKVSVNEARTALASGRVEVNTFASALRAAAEVKFGDVNIRKMQDLGTILEKTKEKFLNLTVGALPESFFAKLSEISKMLDEDTVTGQSLKQAFQTIGQTISLVFGGSSGGIKGFVETSILAFQDLTIVGLKTAIAVKNTWGDVGKKFEKSPIAKLGVEAALVGIGVALGIVAVAGAAVIATLGAAAVAIGAPFVALYEGYQFAKDKIPKLWAEFKAINWGEVGTSILHGIGAGIEASVEWLKNKVIGVATSIKEAFTGSKGIDAHSPSRFFDHEGGRRIPQGVALGVQHDAPIAVRAIERMSVDLAEEPDFGASASAGVGLSAGASFGGGGGGGGRRGPVSISFGDINVAHHGGSRGGDASQGKEIAASIMAELTKMLEESNLLGGIPIQTEVPT